MCITTLPDRASARALAEALVHERLAACVNVMAECTSIYRWQGAVETAAEVPLWIKTRAALYRSRSAIHQRPPPLRPAGGDRSPVTAGLAPYLKWVEHETEQGQRNLEQP